MNADLMRITSATSVHSIHWIMSQKCWGRNLQLDSTS